MRSFVVEDMHERVEGKLLGLQVGCGRTGGVVLESLVHALVPAVLSGFTGLDELAANAQLEEPDGQAGEAGDPGGGEGRAVVGADRLGHAVLAEGELEAVANATFGGREIAVAADEIAAEEAGDGEREAIAAVAGLELSLEVRSPDLVRAQRLGAGASGMALAPRPTLDLDQVVTLEDLGHCASRGQFQAGVVALDAVEQLLGTPRGVLAAH